MKNLPMSSKTLPTSKKNRNCYMETFCLHDKDIIETFLRKQPLTHLYELGDLDDFFWSHTSWYALMHDQNIVQIALLYTRSVPPILLYFPEKESEQAEEFLHSLIPHLPQTFHAHLGSEISYRMPETYQQETYGLHYKMALQNPAAIKNIDTSNVVPLTSDDTLEVEDFYRRSYPGNWFDARLLGSGCYFGVRSGSTLISAAGIHVYSPSYKVAVLGNVATHPVARGQGFATSVCARVCQELQLHVKHIGLNVKANNHAAIACYQRLGFEQVTAYEECLCTLR